MAHLRVQNNTVNDGQSGAFVDIPNPLTEIWVDFELVVTGELPGPATVDWQGEWEDDVAYPANAYVFHNGYSWKAPVDMSIGDEPGVPAFNAVLSHTRGVSVFDYDRINNTVPEVRSFPDDADNTNISGRPGRCIYIDRTGSTAHDVTLKNLHPTQTMDCAFYQDVDIFTMLAFPGMASGVEQTLSIPAAADDLYGVIYFGSGTDVDSGGSFEVSISNAGSLVAPAPIKQNWELIGPGTRGPAVPNLFEFYGMRPFSFDRLPAPVPPPVPPEPEPEPEPDGVVLIDFPADSSTDGRSWEIHFSLAVGGTFTVVHTCEGEGVSLYYDGNDNSADPTLGLGPFPGLPPGDYTVYVGSPTDTERSCSIQIVVSDGATFAVPDGVPTLIDTYVPFDPWYEGPFADLDWNDQTVIFDSGPPVHTTDMPASAICKNNSDLTAATILYLALFDSPQCEAMVAGSQIRITYPSGSASAFEFEAIYEVTGDADGHSGFEQVAYYDIPVTYVSHTGDPTHFDEEHDVWTILP